MLRGQLRELLCDQIVILGKSLQLVLRLVLQQRIDLLGIGRRLLPYANGLPDAVCNAVDSAQPRLVLQCQRVLHRLRLRR